MKHETNVEVKLRDSFSQAMNLMDFPQINKVMEYLDWKWYMKDEVAVPGIYQLILTCNTLFERALQIHVESGQSSSCGTGGFDVEIAENEDGWYVLVRFVLSSGLGENYKDD